MKLIENEEVDNQEIKSKRKINNKTLYYLKYT